MTSERLEGRSLGPRRHRARQRGRGGVSCASATGAGCIRARRSAVSNATGHSAARSQKARELVVSAAIAHSAFLTRSGAEALVGDQVRRGQAVG